MTTFFSRGDYSVEYDNFRIRRKITNATNILCYSVGLVCNSLLCFCICIHGGVCSNKFYGQNDEGYCSQSKDQKGLYNFINYIHSIISLHILKLFVYQKIKIYIKHNHSNIHKFTYIYII